MPRGYRLFFVAAFIAIVLAFGLARILQPQQPDFAGDRGYQEQATSYRAGGSSCEPAKIRSLPVGLRQSKADSCAEAEEQHREAANNLIENRRSAVATEAAAVAGAAQARIEAWGAGIGFLTLFAAIAAALFAERAAFHTKVSADSYRSREKAELVPALKQTPGVVQAIAKNMGPTRATVLISNSSLFEKPPKPIPFIFPGAGRMSVAVEGNSEYDLGCFKMQSVPEFFLIGAIIYEDAFGGIELMKASFKMDTVNMSWAPYWDLDWSEWERETEKARRSKKR